MTSTIPQFEHWIDGHPMPPMSGRHLDSTRPHDGEPVLRIADGCAEDVERAGRATWRIWSLFPASVVSPRRSSSRRPVVT
jgi:aldehyde dehydrogenase (NAD+)